MLSRLSVARALPAGGLRAFSASSKAASGLTIDLEGVFSTHRCDGAFDGAVAETSREELLGYHRLMYAMRRMEITCDNEYKARNIRGFCHLYDGQEAVAVGVESALNREDSWITSYRCHCTALARGETIAAVFAELFGFKEGVAKGKGGSMHMYSKQENFYGGQGIVGAQVPVGTGLAFANRYKTPAGEPMPVAIAMYGDGAVNQGQNWEAANMAALWKLPMIYCIENNKYGMGTSIERHSSNFDYYTMGNNIPGVKVDGMNVLAVREAAKYCKEHCASGNGPIFLEMNTYRYHGHSMSDAGLYRERDEIQATRKARDPIEFVKQLLVDNDLAEAAELKAIEKEVRGEVQAALKEAKAGSLPPMSDLFENVYATPEGTNEYPPRIRMPDTTENRTFG